MEIQVENRLQLPTDSTDEAFVLIDVDGNRRIPTKINSRDGPEALPNRPLALLAPVGSSCISATSL
ncbi:hypothetical protein [Ferrovum myxofaciens]|uniref:hypothetical protein n=1 Tax=Ferrovum myxofaciens TaxID=416213 RepID=UPI000B2DA293